MIELTVTTGAASVWTSVGVPDVEGRQETVLIWWLNNDSFGRGPQNHPFPDKPDRRRMST